MFLPSRGWTLKNGSPGLLYYEVSLCSTRINSVSLDSCSDMNTSVEKWNFTESQNGWNWKGPLEVIWSRRTLKQDHLELVAQDFIQMASTPKPPWCQCLDTLTEQNHFLIFRGNLLGISFQRYLSTVERWQHTEHGITWSNAAAVHNLTLFL